MSEAASCFKHPANTSWGKWRVFSGACDPCEYICVSVGPPVVSSQHTFTRKHQEYKIKPTENCLSCFSEGFSEKDECDISPPDELYIVSVYNVLIGI